MTPTTKQNLAGIFALLSIVAVILAVVLLAADAYPQGITGGTTVDRTARAQIASLSNTVANLPPPGLSNGADIFPHSITLTNIADGTSQMITQWTDIVTHLAPQANFSSTDGNITNGGVVTFTDTSTGSITNRLWDFGDGSTTQLLNAAILSHTYTNGLATNTVSLTVAGLLGQSTKTDTGLVIVASALGIELGSLHFTKDTETGNGGYVRLSNFPEAPNIGTWETWVKLDSTEGAAGLIDRNVEGNGQRRVDLAQIDGEVFAAYGSTTNWIEETHTIEGMASYALIEAGVWTHIALCVTTSNATLFVNGTACKRGFAGGGTNTVDVGLRFGKQVDNGNWNQYTMQGFMSLTRISDIPRYDGDFTPTTNWQVDEHTVALWRFADGTGDTLTDATGQHDATIDGLEPHPTWSSEHP